MPPRQLFVDEPPANASNETLHIVTLPMRRKASEEMVDVDAKDPFADYEDADKLADPLGVAAVKPAYPRPRMLNLASDAATLPNLRYSTASSVTLPTSPTPSSTSTPNKPPPIQPSLRLLFSLTSRSTFYCVVLPALILSIVAGLIPPYMTQVLGGALQAFTDYSAEMVQADLTIDDVKAIRATLLASVQKETIKFVVLAAVVLVVATSNVALWVVHGERVARALRLKVYAGLSEKGLDWFDKGMGGAKGDGEAEASGDSAAGLMGRFTKDTDDVRVAASQNLGMIIQYIGSFVFCLILSFYRDYRLTFVILSTVPLLSIFVSVSERFAGPLANHDRECTTKCSARVDRIVAAIPTVKAFNAEQQEIKGFQILTKQEFSAYVKLHFVWGLRSGVTQFMLLAMFVQGFWFGAYLISSGKASASTVNTCFWSCLLASGYLQTTIPFLVTLEKGKVAMAGMLELIRAEPEPVATLLRVPGVSKAPTFGRRSTKRSKRQFGSLEGSASRAAAESSPIDDTKYAAPLSPHPFQLSSPTSPNTPILIPLASATMMGRRRPAAPRALRKLRPSTFSGELSLRNVTFHYPTRPSPAPPALDNVSLYIAARETTYVVGTSGSGKSTVGSLLLGLYRADAGRVEVDEQGLEWIEEDWLRGHVACVSQGASVLFDGTIHDNVAIGVVGQIQEDGGKRKAEDVTRDEVIAACRGALIHDFIRDLPDGYDTLLSGEKGASLSGGQRQRLAIARAWIRDPTVLILDEATSALDATSRLLVNEAVKRWRTNRTTIIITHDLAPIGADDFVYIMADGHVVEQGYRGDLERSLAGRFAELAYSQKPAPAGTEGDDDAEVLGSDDDEGMTYSSVHSTPRIKISDADSDPAPYSVASFLFPPCPESSARASRELRDARRVSANFMERINSRDAPATPPRPALSREPSSDLLPPFALSDSPAKRSRRSSKRDSGMSFAALELAGNSATLNRRPLGTRIKHKTMNPDDLKEWTGKSHGSAQESVVIEVDSLATSSMSLTQLARRYWPMIPNKMLFFLGMFLSVVVGCCTPVFSTLISSVMAHLGTPNSTGMITKSSLLILLVALIDGTSTFLKFYFLERCAMGWITALRRKSLDLVLKQDKAFFDRPENSTSALTHSIIKDSEDTRIFVGTVVGQLAVLGSMLTLGIVWAFVAGWELTLVGLGLAPVFIVAIRAQASVLNKFEASNKIKREAVSKKFHQTMGNVRAIRSMSIHPVFVNAFLASTEDAYAGGVKAAPFSGFGFALGFTLTYCSEGLMLYVGALLIVHGRYDFAKMLQVFSLIMFSVTFAGQVMGYLPGMAKSIRAAIDLLRLLDLEPDTRESEGRMTFPIQGHVSFSDVNFAYPSRPDVPVLKGLSFDVKPGEASGSGKSTVAALLQRLYEPSSGSVLLDGRPLSRVDVQYLRSHVAVVSQHPALFDMTVSANVAYGRPDTAQADVEAAAQQAHIHEFVKGLPQGYQTMLGDNAGLVSGGQAQRLQIARALVQPREILILDECTSALDAANQAAVVETILSVKTGRTTLIVTHKLAIMEKCDYLVVVADGVVAEM
ncbi:SPOSA6832_05082 [Sporobolomyces salmonicolor]|uniref:SPOSA6832_05082-mRNA-1:cds n=1 Tax=Sporidiobolus salmonicolor TaxID=5005 RepID=A0A0D6ETM9_SPOSA|nr:SPOSA6832_05082 [Sporobolomyces salmonicolor]